MSRWNFTSTSFSISLLLVAFISLLMSTQGNARAHYMLENSDEATSSSNQANVDYKPECYITVQKIKTVGGHCVKIRDNFRGCIAGTLMDPFHQDCL